MPGRLEYLMAAASAAALDTCDEFARPLQNEDNNLSFSRFLRTAACCRRLVNGGRRRSRCQGEAASAAKPRTPAPTERTDPGQSGARGAAERRAPGQPLEHFFRPSVSPRFSQGGPGGSRSKQWCPSLSSGKNNCAREDGPEDGPSKLRSSSIERARKSTDLAEFGNNFER